MELHLRSNNSELYIGANNGNLYLSVFDSNSQRLNYTFCLSEENLALINAYFQAHKAANKPEDKSEEKKDEQKSAWSEEDEMRIKRLCDFVWANRKGDTDEISQQEKDVYWLKSLIPQNTWKPSDEQMDALRYVTNFNYGGHKATLVSLYEQLKKLMEG